MSNATPHVTISARAKVGFLTLMLAAFGANPAHAAGLLVPSEPGLPPLALVYHRVRVEIKDQAAVTRIDQEFRNSTARPLEAYYLFPVPAGAAVKDFAMWVDGKRTSGELVEAGKARAVYEDIVRRTKDPGLLEHLGDNLFRVRVFPVPANGSQRIELAYTGLARRDSGVCEYIYPLQTGSGSARTVEDCTIQVELNSSSVLQSVYSPTHAVSVSRPSDHRAVVGFEMKGYSLDHDFQLLWTTSEKDVGLSFLTFRESPGEPGYFLAMIAPRTDLPAAGRVPRDLIFVIDTSGSMAGEKMEQAKQALVTCLNSLAEVDRFNVVAFSTTVNPYETALVPVTKDSIAKAVQWVRGLTAVGGTAISEAIESALSFRASGDRNFTVLFLTDGLPTIGQTDPKAILAGVGRRNTASTRIFTMGIGYDVNTHLLDQLAETTRATSVYIHPGENIETKASSFYAKISRPVLANLKLAVAGGSASLSDMYPPVLPDLFHGGQLLAVGRFTGAGPASFRLTGVLGEKPVEFVSETTLPTEKRENDFLPLLWANRKVGYLLDQIRQNGENKELVDEVTRLAKKYGIVTPYTSYLLVPDQPVPPGVPRPPFPPHPIPLPGPRSGGFSGPTNRMDRLKAGAPAASPAPVERALDAERRELADSTDGGIRYFGKQAAEGEAAVRLSEALKDQKKVEQQAAQQVRQLGRQTFVQVHGVWIDRAYQGDKHQNPKKIQYLSPAYFRMLELAPELKRVLALGPQVVWVTPSGQALAIDTDGADKLSDAEIRDMIR